MLEKRLLELWVQVSKEGIASETFLNGVLRDGRHVAHRIVIHIVRYTTFFQLIDLEDRIFSLISNAFD